MSRESGVGSRRTGSDESRIPSPESRIISLIRERGPLTVAAFMELALYHPEFGYYARAGQRSGRAGDFFTSVDVGAIFGELVAAQIAEMLALLESRIANPESGHDLVEAGAGNGRLSADIMRALKQDHAGIYDATRLHLVETSAAARGEQRGVLGDVADRLASSGPSLPDSFEGVLFANELLDAMPVHQVVMRDGGLHEIYVAATPDFRLTTHDGEPSTPRLADYLSRVGARLEPGWRAEINLNAVDWIRDAARRLRRGFIVLIDYGHEARELYSASHAAGTLTTFRRHQSGDRYPVDARTPVPVWLHRTGKQDITAHVDWTSIRAAAEDEGMQTIALLDQTYFLLGIVSSNPESRIPSPGLKTLLMPGGLGSVMKVLILGKGVGRPPLIGTSFKIRAT